MQQTAVVMNDFQIPFQDATIMSLVQSFVRELKPDTLIWNGDIVDCYSISNFDRNPLTLERLEDERSIACEYMALFSDVRRKIWIGGNHEDRLRRFLWRHASPLAGVGELEFSRLFFLGHYGFEWVEYNEYVMLGKLLVTHGSLVNKHSASTARSHFEKYGSHVIIGHTHRMGSYYKTQLGVPYVAFENGCLCSLTPEWIKYPDWQQGFSVVHYDDESGVFNVQQVPIFYRNGRPTFYYGRDRIQ